MNLPIALVGLMGSGKSTVASRLARRLDLPLVDLDAEIERVAHRSVADLFAGEGEAAFRRREEAALERALEHVAVIACGGGAVLGEVNRSRLRERSRVVWLEVDADAAALRLATDSGARPLLEGADRGLRLAALLEERAPLYAAVAHIRIDTTALDAAAVTEAVAQALAELDA